jgi:hypothetical protein
LICTYFSTSVKQTLADKIHIQPHLKILEGPANYNSPVNSYYSHH